MGLKKWYLNLATDVQNDLDRLCTICDKHCVDLHRGCLFKWNIYQFSKTKSACKFVEKYKNKVENKENKDGNN